MFARAAAHEDALPAFGAQRGAYRPWRYHDHALAQAPALSALCARKFTAEQASLLAARECCGLASLSKLDAAITKFVCRGVTFFLALMLREGILQHQISALTA